MHLHRSFLEFPNSHKTWKQRPSYFVALPRLVLKGSNTISCDFTSYAVSCGPWNGSNARFVSAEVSSASFLFNFPFGRPIAALRCVFLPISTSVVCKRKPASRGKDVDTEHRRDNRERSGKWTTWNFSPTRSNETSVEFVSLPGLVSTLFQALRVERFCRSFRISGSGLLSSFAAKMLDSFLSLFFELKAHFD